MDAELARLIWYRAAARCEHCRLPQSAAPITTFQVEHIRPRQHGGLTVAENLALACPRCNCFKGPNLTGIDPLTDGIVELFHPRRQLWSEHFSLVAAEIMGITSTGRTTAHLLRMNDPDRIDLRAELIDCGEF